MTRDAHYRLITGLGLCEFGDGLMAQIVEAQTVRRTNKFSNVSSTLAVSTRSSGILHMAARWALDGPRQSPPRRPPAFHWACGIGVGIAFRMREDVPIWRESVSEEAFGSFAQFENGRHRASVER
jgi:hypothetical protein